MNCVCVGGGGGEEAEETMQSGVEKCLNGIYNCKTLQQSQSNLYYAIDPCDHRH